MLANYSIVIYLVLIIFCYAIFKLIVVIIKVLIMIEKRDDYLTTFYTYMLTDNLSLLNLMLVCFH